MKYIICIVFIFTVTLAQIEIQTPEAVAAQEGSGIPFVPDESGQYVPIASLLDMIYECNRATGQILDVDGNGAEDFRVYGFDFVDAESYKLRGPRAFSSATRKAETRAIGSATEYLFGVATFTSRYLEDTESEVDTAASTGSPTGEDRERLRSLSITTRESFRQITATGSAGFVKGGRPSGTKYVSLGGDYGYCVVVRYDVPLDQSGPPPGYSQDAQSPSQPSTAPPADGGANGDDGSYPPIPPGSSGDF